MVIFCTAIHGYIIYGPLYIHEIDDLLLIPALEGSQMPTIDVHFDQNHGHKFMLVLISSTVILCTHIGHLPSMDPALHSMHVLLHVRPCMYLRVLRTVCCIIADDFYTLTFFLHIRIGTDRGSLI